MKRETLRQLLELSKDEKSAAQVLEMIQNYENKYEDGTDGTTIKLRIFKDKEGNVVTEICDLIEYRDITKMSLEELRVYYSELEEEHDELQGDEPDDEDSDEYEDWEDRVSELEDELDEVYTLIANLEGNEG